MKTAVLVYEAGKLRRIMGAALLFALLTLCFSCSTDKIEYYDVVVVGGGTSGAAAGIQSARTGVRTLIVEPTPWLGGMLTSAGVSATDGNYKLRGGIWGEFLDSLEVRYGGAEALKTGWVSNVMFNPAVGAEIFRNMAGAEPALTLLHNSTVEAFERVDGIWKITVLTPQGREKIEARVMIDATELGDIAKSAGIPYDVGMDSRSVTGEEIAPEKANAIIQDLTYVMVLKDYGRDVTIDRPEGYDPGVFACCCVNDNCVNPKEAHRLWSREMMITYGELPGKLYMINWPIEGNDYYVDMVEMTAEEREPAIKQAKNHSLCFLYFLQAELGFSSLGLADDIFPTEDNFPLIPYHRESRRIHGEVRFTVNHITDPYGDGRSLYRTAVGVGDYPVDQHHTRYSGWAELPDLYFHPVPSYGVPLGILIPQSGEGLLVAEKSVSVTNIVNGSTRLQPVVLQIGQAAGALAALSVTQNKFLREVPVRDVQSVILEAGGYLLPYLDLPPTHPHFGAVQRIGSSGILKGEGVNAGWENQTWFYTDRKVDVREIAEGLREVYPEADLPVQDGTLTVKQLMDYIGIISGVAAVPKLTSIVESEWSGWDFGNFSETRELNRLECAVILDRMLDPFNSVPVDIHGKFLQ